MRLEDVGAALRHLRELRRMTQAEVARRAGCSQGQVSRWEVGSGNMSVDTLFRVLGAMRWRLVDLGEAMKAMERDRRGE